ncbi:GDSL-motif lipase/hydrolase family protein [Gracilaria domingensis]|nr:GDSL-motif lipase/hydrolase family protein [Gracilaria domingensis]
MMSATPEREVLSQPPPPPQPPLSLPDPPFQPPPTTPPLPQIVHGIDPDDDSPDDSQSSMLRDSMADVFSNLSARVSRAVRLTKSTSTLSNTKREHPKSQLPCVLLFGDSITEQSVVSSDQNAPGWSALLREAYQARVEVFVRGFSGYNTRWALHLFPRIIEPFFNTETLALQTVVIFFGANDATTPTSLQHVPLDSYAQNLATLVDAVKALPSKPVPVLVTPPALGKSRHAIDDERRMESTAKYAEACVETGRRLGVPVVDLHAAMVGRACDDDGVDVFLSDGLHLAPDGNRLVYDLLAEVFAECVPEVCPRNCPPSYPHYGEIDPDNPAEMLGESALV